MDNAALARHFATIADLLEVRGDNFYRTRAYREAARSLADWPEPVAEVAARGELRSIPGVGEAIASKIEELLETGTTRFFEELRREIDPSILELLSVPGIGPRKARALYQHLGVVSLASLREAAEAGRLRGLSGFGERAEQAILRALERMEQRDDHLPLAQALPLAERLARELAALPEVASVALAGSVRRMRPMVRDVDLVVDAADPSAALTRLASLLTLEGCRIEPGLQVRGVVEGIPVHLFLVPPVSWGAVTVLASSAEAHRRWLVERARAYGLTWEPFGLVRGEGGLVEVADEEAAYGLVGLPWIPPELREAAGIDAAMLSGLVRLEDLAGDLHTHTHWSDGVASLEEMAEAARARGYRYLAITDHSRSLGVANGLSLERLRQQVEAIRELNRRLAPFRLLAGVELEIRADGSLDFPDEVLAELDLVAASLHSSQGQSRERITARLLGAIRNPYVDVISHPTGRILGRRDPCNLDLEAVFAAAAATGTVLEINASPERLDLGDEQARAAAVAGVRLSISTDAHAPAHLEFARLGVAIARRAGLARSVVWNCLELDELLERRKRARRRE